MTILFAIYSFFRVHCKICQSNCLLFRKPYCKASPKNEGTTNRRLEKLLSYLSSFSLESSNAKSAVRPMEERERAAAAGGAHVFHSSHHRRLRKIDLLRSGGILYNLKVA